MHPDSLSPSDLGAPQHRAMPPDLAQRLANPVLPKPALIALLRETMAGIVRRDGADLSARQMAVFLEIQTKPGPHTVRGLAALLNVSKPAITRALDRLGELDLARRKVDPLDRRSVLVQRTMRGAAFLGELQDILQEAAQVAA